jgi:integrase
MAGRSINIEGALLSRAIGKPWRTLWPTVRKLEENTDVGRALSAEKQKKILLAAFENRSPVVGTFIKVLLLTAMRSRELLSMSWGQVDFTNQTVRVGRAKSEAGTGRLIPMNAELLRVLEGHAIWYVERFGERRRAGQATRSQAYGAKRIRRVPSVGLHPARSGRPCQPQDAGALQPPPDGGKAESGSRP